MAKWRTDVSTFLPSHFTICLLHSRPRLCRLKWQNYKWSNGWKKRNKSFFFCHPSLRHNNKLSLDHCRCIIIDWYSRNYVVHKKKASWRSHLRSNPTFCRKNVRKKLIKHKHREWIRNGYANSLYSDSKVHYWSSGDSMKTDLKLHTLNALLRQTPNRFGEITSQKS